MTPLETQVAELLAAAHLHRDRAAAARENEAKAFEEARDLTRKASVAMARSVEFRHEAEDEQEEEQRLIAEAGKLVVS